MFALVAAIALQSVQPTDFRSDFDALTGDLAEYGAYLRSDHVDLGALTRVYRPRFASVPDRDHLIALLEVFMGELHDFHATLGTNNGSSPRLVPSGTDLIGRWEGNRAFIEQVRPGSVAQKAGLAANDEILTIGGKPVREAAAAWFGIRKPDARAWHWALNSALAGRWNEKRTLTTIRASKKRTVEFATATRNTSKARLKVENRPGGVVYLRPEDSLGDNKLIADFDRLVPSLRSAKGVILDLRNTPSGGNSAVARGMMGLFISKRLPYQRHLAEERDTATVRDWVEYASPRISEAVKARLVVLVDHWTGSMGEGIAIGLDAMHRATVIGTHMAGLRGAVDGFELPKSGIRVFFPTEQVFHVKGTPRHEWSPPVKVAKTGIDPWAEAANRILAKPARGVRRAGRPK